MRILSIISGKGGVGKTTIAANLSLALSKLGFNTTVVDLNITTPDLGFYFGHYTPEVGLQDILKDPEKLPKGIYIHSEGIKILPGKLQIERWEDVDLSNLNKIINSLNADFVVLDSAAGLGREALASLSLATDVLVITNPELPTLIDALKVIKVAENLNKNILGIALNRVGRSKKEIKKDYVERLLGYKVLAEIPEDKWVVRALEEKIPLISFNPHCRASIEIMNLAFAILGTPYRIKPSIWDKILFWK